MDPRTQVNRQPSSSHASQGGAVATEATREPRTNANSSQPTPASDERTARPSCRESVDPMRSTDRYRLVHPVNAGL